MGAGDIDRCRPMWINAVCYLGHMIAYSLQWWPAS
jgi:hypothetical protein